jgi:lipopolysaccharide/colanic/teichoic acid biosynthesis glycosyltransferase
MALGLVEALGWRASGSHRVSAEDVRLVYDIAKRACDVIIAFCVLLLCVPLILVTGAMIWFEAGGPVLYRARRVGRNGRLFDMYKFRTMGPQLDFEGPRVTAQDDARVTPLGRVLRWTKLNELPQLLNVLKGDMSLVGPRPEDPEFVAQYSEQERAVLSVRPGVTSPASLLFFEEEKLLRAATAGESYLREIMPTKLRLDLLYLRNRSLLLDLDILFRTVLAVLPTVNWRASGVHDVLAGPIQRILRRHASWLAADVLVSLLAIGAAGAAWRSVGPLDVGWGRAVVDALAFAGVFALVNSLTGVQRTWWRYAGTRDALELALSGICSTGLILIANAWLFPGYQMPLRVLASACALALTGFFALRYWRRLTGGLVALRGRLMPAAAVPCEKVLVVGAGDAAQSVVRSILKSARSRVLHVVGFADDDVWKRGDRIHGVSVLGSCADIPRLAKEHDVGMILFAIHNIAAAERDGLLAACRGTGARVVVVPDILARLESAAEWSAGAGERQRRATVSGSGTFAGPNIDADIVASWLSEIDRLVSEGRYNTLRQRVRDLRASILTEGRAAKGPDVDEGVPDGAGRMKHAGADRN